MSVATVARCLWKLPSETNTKRLIDKSKVIVVDTAEKTASRKYRTKDCMNVAVRDQG